MSTRTIFFIGKPGCGKGTQAKLLAEHTGWSVFSSGRLFREIAQEDTPVGRKVKEENDAGVLQPHWFAMYLYLKSLFSLPEDSGVIFDGFNRKVPEAELVIDSLRWLGRPFEVVNVAISDEEAVKRLAIRKTEERRIDDGAVPERLKEFNTFTKDAIELFRTAGALVDVDGERSREAIAEDIRAKLHIR